MQGAGWHFLQIPGPSNLPGSVRTAISRQTIDHRGAEFSAMFKEIADGLKPVFGTEGPIVIFPSSGTGAWEAALVNSLSPGDRVLMFETGHFSRLWAEMAERIGLKPEVIRSDWRRGVRADAIAMRLQEDRSHQIRAVCIVHNETSTGVRSSVRKVREALDACKHPALLMVDTISSLASTEFRHDAWGVDVTISCSQKGLMLPPGLGFNAISGKALEAHGRARLQRCYFDWGAILEANERGQFPYTPATNLLFGLQEVLRLLHDEGLENVYGRHDVLAAATRAAVEAWDLEIVCADPAEYSNTLTAVLMPEGVSADALRANVLERWNIALGNGLSRLSDRAFRIGHLGHLGGGMLLAVLSGVEMGLRDMQVRLPASGVQAAMDLLRNKGGDISAS